METLADLLTSVGGMGVCILVLVYLGKYALDSLIPLLGEFRDSIESNTLAINTLCERLTHHLDIIDKE